jgi:hypothetical protein
MDNRLIREIAGARKKVPEVALILMLVGILLPTALYSFRLTAPTAAELLVAISIALFASVLFLWIMDATGILIFRAAWMSKAVYGAAIVSILGTSVAVYKDYFSTHKYPYEGAWQATLTSNDDPSHRVEFSLLLSYSEPAATYWGYSNLIATDTRSIIWTRVSEFSPEEHTLSAEIYWGDGARKNFQWSIEAQRKATFVRSVRAKTDFVIELHRPN